MPASLHCSQLAVRTISRSSAKFRETLRSRFIRRCIIYNTEDVISHTVERSIKKILARAVNYLACNQIRLFQRLCREFLCYSGSLSPYRSSVCVCIYFSHSFPSLTHTQTYHFLKFEQLTLEITTYVLLSNRSTCFISLIISPR
jgi:hypothetical protein